MKELNSTAFTREAISLGDQSLATAVLGEGGATHRLLEEAFPGLQVVPRGIHWTLLGPASSVDKARTVLAGLVEVAKAQGIVDLPQIEESIQQVLNGQAVAPVFTPGVVFVTAEGKRIRAKSQAQADYLDAIAENELVFAIGPAGTGKTYLAMAMAVAALRRRDVERIILTRPAVEAGEQLGFLPGDLQEKVDPYLRPLYDALHEMLGAEHTQRYMEKGMIEVAPLAYMRGRTLNHSFVILDEAQNTTAEQMKMFLTRLGERSQMVITGDVTQIDLPGKQTSGLVQVQRVLHGVEGAAFVWLTERDVIRHPMVRRIIMAYAAFDLAREEGMGNHGTEGDEV